MACSAVPIDAPGWRIDEAGGWLGRARGLLGRSGLPARQGLWLRTRSVHTIGMRFPLDLVWLDRAGAVIRVDRDVAPGRLRNCARAHGVVELAAGEGGALATALGAATNAAESQPITARLPEGRASLRRSRRT